MGQKKGDGAAMEGSEGEMDGEMEDDEEEDDDDDEDQASQGMEGDGEKKPQDEEDEHVFDVAYELQSQIKEYKDISAIFRKNKVPYAERELKRSIIYDNQLDPEVEKGMKRQKDRYPLIEDGLFINPFRVEKKAKKGKKKKKK